MIAPLITLDTIRETFLLTKSVSAGYAGTIIVTCNKLRQFLGGSPDVRSLTPPILSSFVKWIEETRAARTAKKHRANLMVLLNFAEEQGIIESAPSSRKIRKPKVAPPAPSAWTPEEIEALAAAARSMPGKFSDGTPRGAYLSLLIRVAWESGLRRGDLFALDMRCFRGAMAQVRMKKTSEPHCFELEQDTLADLQAMALLRKRNDPLAFPAGLTAYRKWFAKIKAAAKLGSRPRELLQQVRRSGATAWENQDASYTSRYLGHRTAEMKEYYVDQSKIGGKVKRIRRAAARPTMPPEG